MTTTAPRPTETTSPPAGARFAEIPTSDLHPDDNNRHPGDTTDLEASFAAKGILVPLMVTPRPDGDGYTVRDGGRRLKAAAALGLMLVPCDIRHPADEATALEDALIASLVRREHSPLEEAEAFERLIATYEIPAKAVAERTGRSESHISKRRALLKLPDAARDAVEDGKLTIETAYEIARIPDDEDRDHFVSEWVEELDVGAGIHQAARAAAERAELEQRRQDLADELQKMGETVIDWPLNGRTKWRVCRKGEDAKAYAVDERAHAVSLTDEELPDDLRRTITPDAKPTAEQKAQRDLFEAERRERDAAKATRRSTAKSILEAGPTRAKAALIEHVIAQTVRANCSDFDAWPDPADACELLGLEPKDRLAATRTLAEYAERGPGEALRAAGALMLTGWDPAPHEIEDGDVGTLWGEPGILAHFGLLYDHGYKPTDEELEGLKAGHAANAKAKK